MKYLALLSGGKDSCFNLLHCSKHGHELVAAASLCPEPGKDELDSYLYQTVGQDAIEYVARALDVPLYRRIITGDAVDKRSEYGGRNAKDAGGVHGDETEDLYELLVSVLVHHPEVKGVSVGAILSNYQRVRVEHVCRRLGLTTLCYLWQRNQEELLSEMIEAGMTAVLIKVAGIGLTTNHLGKTLDEMQPTLLKLNSQYGSHVCGEGGEYESLTLDSPMFKARIVLTEVETVIHSDNDFAVVAYLRIKSAKLEPKTSILCTDSPSPPLLEDGLCELRDAIGEAQAARRSNALPASPQQSETGLELFTSSKRIGNWIEIANVNRDVTDLSKQTTIEEEVSQCFSILEDHLASYGLRLSHCANINLFLSSMDLFGSVNAVYSQFFGTSPPSRACVAVRLPSPIRVRLDCIAFAEQRSLDRQALHVQSLSYWAPANIGPYSQAIIAAEQVFISGQIGLIPSQLLLADSLATQTALACQHAARVTQALRDNTGGNWIGHAQLEIFWFANIDYLSVVRTVLSASKGRASPALFVAVEALPKGALVEKQVLLHTGRCEVKDEDDGEISIQSKQPMFYEYTFPTEESCIHLEMVKFADMTSFCALIFVRGDVSQTSNLLALSERTRLSPDQVLSIRAFYVTRRKRSLATVLGAVFSEGADQLPLSYVATKAISNMYSDDWDCAICILGF